MKNHGKEASWQGGFKSEIIHDGGVISKLKPTLGAVSELKPSLGFFQSETYLRVVSYSETSLAVAWSVKPSPAEVQRQKATWYLPPSQKIEFMSWTNISSEKT